MWLSLVAREGYGVPQSGSAQGQRPGLKLPVIPVLQVVVDTELDTQEVRRAGLVNE